MSEKSVAWVADAEGPVVICSVVLMRLKSTLAARRAYTYQPRKPPGAPRYAQKPAVCLFKRQQGSEYVTLPRDPALLPLLAQNTRVQVVDGQRPRPPRIDATAGGFVCSLDPGRQQPVAVDSVLALLTAHPLGGGGLLSLPTGFGKTTCALHIAACLSRRTLILVHTTVLKTQWLDRIASAVPSAHPVAVSPETYGRGHAQWAGTHVIVLLQTLLARADSDHPPLCEGFDMVIVDEVHHLSAPTLSQAMEVAGCRYRLGLSATMDRKDGMECMLDHLIGPVAMHVHRTENPGIVVYSHTYNTEVVPDDVSTEECTVSQALSLTSLDQGRNVFVAGLARQWHDQGRFIVVMSDRRAQLESLAGLLAAAEVPIAWAVGGEKTAPDVSTRPVILATYAFASEGMDIPALDCCILATSRCELRQSIGRILRKSGDGHNPVVVDVVDQAYRVLRKQGVKRKRWYRAALDKGGLAAMVVDA